MGLNLEKINFFEYSKKTKKEKIVLFGAGVVCKKFINSFDKSSILFICDNNKKLWGTKFDGIQIKNPNILKQNKFKNLTVVIMTTSFVDIIKQLKKIITLRVYVSSLLKNLLSIEYLQNIKKNILISSGLPPIKNKKNGGGLYLIKLNGNKYDIKKVYSGTVHGVINYKNGYAISDSVNGVIILNKNFKVIKKGSYPLNTRAHGISYDENNNFYVACSMTDKIKIFNKNLRFVDSISISEKFEKMKSPQHHLNDIYIKDGNLYVSMFSLSGNHKRNVYDGGVCEIDLKTKKINNVIYTNLIMPHSIKYVNDSFAVLDSLNGDLIVGIEKIANFPGFSRGLSYDGKFYFIGQSRNRNFSLVSQKKNNISIDNSIIIYDYKNKISRNIILPFQISEIHEVLVMS
jgi:hypothetical protein